MEWYEEEKIYEKLLDAIIVQAVKDLKKYIEAGNVRQINKIKDFFTSDWFYTITDIKDGENLFNEIYRRLEDEINRNDS